MIDRRTVLGGLVAVATAATLAACSPEPERRFRIGVLSPFPRKDVEHLLQLMRPELARLGWIEDRNIAFLPLRAVDGQFDRLSASADELVAEGADVIVVQSAPATRAAMAATKSIPILMIAVGNPVEYGIVADLKSPGANVTGSSFLADESILKLLHLLADADPRIRNVAVFVNPTNEGAAPMMTKLRAEQAKRGIEILFVEVRTVGDFDGAFDAVRKAGSRAIMLAPEPLIRSRRETIAKFAVEHKLALAVVGAERYLPPGGLIAYAPASDEYPRLAARQLDRLLRGAKPADIPVEQPSRFELTLDLRAAQALGIELPKTLVDRASITRNRP